MKKNIFLTVACVCTALSFVNAQEVEYTAVEFSYQKPAVFPELQKYKTFDVTFKSDIESLEKQAKEIPALKPEFGKLEYVENSEDLHVIATLYSLRQKKNATGSDVFDIDLDVVVSNRYGTRLHEERYNYVENAYRPTADNEKYGSPFSCVLQSLSWVLSKYTEKVYGGNTPLSTALAALDDVKKKSDLYQSKEQVKVLSKALQSQGASGFVAAAAQYVPLWEQWTQFSEGKKANEVKRAAYHNLIVYHLLGGNKDKATPLIEAYKKVDKEIKLLFGLERYKQSDNCVKLMNYLEAKPEKIDENAAGTAVLTKVAIADKIWYHLVDGAVTIKDKRVGGTYTGLIKIRKVPLANKSGGMVDLDAADVDMWIVTEKEGKPQTIQTVISKVESLTDKGGKKYIIQKFSNAIAFASAGNAGNYAFLEASYESPKVIVYRCLIPVGLKEYVVRKTGDEKGIRSGGLTDTKNLTNYFSDCAPFAAKLKSGEIDKKAAPEKLAEIYTDCK